MKFSALLAAVVLVSSSASAIAAGPYIGAASGLSAFHNSDLSKGGTGEIEYEAGGAFGVTAGYDFDGIRIEGEASRKHADVDTFRQNDVPEGSMDTTIYSYMLNAYWDIKTPSRVTPYLGVGIGKLHAKMTDPSDAYKDKVFGYQFSTGVGIKLVGGLNLDLAYRYQAAADDFFIGIYDVSYASSNFLAGVRYNF